VLAATGHWACHRGDQHHDPTHRPQRTSNPPATAHLSDHQLSFSNTRWASITRVQQPGQRLINHVPK
jgi:hypothetical protein